MRDERESQEHRALMLAASHCTHPELDATDSFLLNYLALNGDHGTGANSHPCNRNIADALKLRDRPTDTRLKKAIERGLIERTERANGRGKASAIVLGRKGSQSPISNNK